MELVQCAEGYFLQVMDKMLEVIGGGVEYQQFQEELRDSLNSLGAQVCGLVLEGMDKYLMENRQERKGWVIERREDEKSILTQFGTVRYKRTYYSNKQTGENAYLVDRMAGIAPHEKVDGIVKGKLVEIAASRPYRESGKEWGGEIVSGQTVMKSIRGFDAGKVGLPEVELKRQIKTLYIEADEDHVSGRDGKKREPKLVYVHEGWNWKNKRVMLKHPYYIAGMYKRADELWTQVWEYMDATYDLKGVEKIFIAGDGAKWIRQGQEVIPGAIYVLDRYHLEQYIRRAVGNDYESRKAIWAGIKESSQEKVIAGLKQADNKSAGRRRDWVVKAVKYISNNWDGIEAYKKYPEHLGSNAEGHVGHILSNRLSRAPQSWGEIGINQMSKLRAMKANNCSIFQEYVEQKKPVLSVIKVCEKAIVEERRRIKKAIRLEVYDNMPALSAGRLTQLRRALRGLSRPA